MSVASLDHGPLIIVGAGIGGLAAALACMSDGPGQVQGVQVLEQSSEHAEYGAGVQLGPNVTRLLRAWGLLDELRQLSGAPSAVQVRDVATGRHLAQMPLGSAAEERYGAPYLSVHRADLHGVLARQAAARGVAIRLDMPVQGVDVDPAGTPSVQLPGGAREFGAAVIGADGINSVVRGGLPACADAVQASGHLALRALIPADRVDARGLLDVVTTWLGPHHHIVTYPVRARAALNVVIAVDAWRLPSPPVGHGWAARLPTELVQEALDRLSDGVCSVVREALAGSDQWGVWPLRARSPIQHVGQMVHGRLALLGDAAHPTLPYLAQGAGMAIEDAAVLAQCLHRHAQADWPQALQTYAALRVDRCARIQRRSRSNGRVFHARGPMRWGRDLALAVAGARLMDMPWLYEWRLSTDES